MRFWIQFLCCFLWIRCHYFFKLKCRSLPNVVHLCCLCHRSGSNSSSYNIGETFWTNRNTQWLLPEKTVCHFQTYTFSFMGVETYDWIHSKWRNKLIPVQAEKSLYVHQHTNAFRKFMDKTLEEKYKSEITSDLLDNQCSNVSDAWSSLIKNLNFSFHTSASFLAEIPLMSPRKLFIFIIKKNIYRIKVSKK